MSIKIKLTIRFEIFEYGDFGMRNKNVIRFWSSFEFEDGFGKDEKTNEINGGINIFQCNREERLTWCGCKI